MKDCIDNLIENILSEATNTAAEPWTLKDSGDLDARRAAWTSYFDSKLASFRQAKADAIQQAKQKAQKEHDDLLATIDNDKLQKYEDLFNQRLVDTGLFHDIYDPVLKKMGLYNAFKALDRSRFEDIWETGKYYIPGLQLSKCNPKATNGLLITTGSYSYIKKAEEEYGKNDPVVKTVKALWVAQFKDAANYKLISSKMINEYNTERARIKRAINAFKIFLDKKSLETYNSQVPDEDKIKLEILDDASIETYLDTEYDYGRVRFVDNNDEVIGKNLYDNEDAKNLAMSINREIDTRMKKLAMSKSDTITNLTNLIDNDLKELREAIYLANGSYYALSTESLARNVASDYIRRSNSNFNKKFKIALLGTDGKETLAELSDIEDGSLISLTYKGLTYLANNFTESDFNYLYGDSDLSKYKDDILKIATEDQQIELYSNPLGEAKVTIYTKETVSTKYKFINGFNRWFLLDSRTFNYSLD